MHGRPVKEFIVVVVEVKTLGHLECLFRARILLRLILLVGLCIFGRGERVVNLERIRSPLGLLLLFRSRVTGPLHGISFLSFYRRTR